MGRKQEFNRGITVQKALRIFWKSGYESTTLQMLLKYLNILNGSFYHTFKNKKKLFLQSLEVYHEDFMTNRNLVFASPHTFKKKLIYLFDKVLDRQLNKECPRGCFLFNSINTDTMSDSEINKQIRKYIEELELFFENEIKTAIEKGELNPHISAGISSKILVKYMSGLMQMSTLKYDDKSFRIETNAFVHTIFGEDVRFV